MSRRIFTWIYVCICVVSSFETYAQFKNNIVAIGGGGFVTGIVSHPKTGEVYCRTDVGGAYKWDAAANSWVQLLDWLPESQGGLSGIESMAIDPQNPNNIYMLCGNKDLSGGMTAILKSTDKGNTFTVIDVTSKFRTHANGYGRGNGERLAVDPNNSNVLYCGTKYNGLWKSTDAGYTWTLAWDGVTTTSNNNGICFVLFDPANTSNGVTNTIYIGVSRVWGANVYKSTDGGVTFTDISPDQGYMPHRAALKGTALYLTLADGEGPGTNGAGKVYKLNTATGVWTDITPFGKNMSYGGVGIDPANVNRVVVSTTGVYGNGMYGGSPWGDFIYFSDDGGANWTLKNGFASTYDNNGMAWFDGQAHWVECAEFDPWDSKKVRTVGGMGILTCSDIEATTPTWKFDVKGIEETVLLDATCIPGGPLVSAFGDVSGFVHKDITAFPAKRHQPMEGNNSGVTYAGKNTNKLVRTTAEGAHIYYSTDQGATWTACATNKGSDGRVALSADGGTILHCPGNSNTVYYSTDNGSSWTASSGSSEKNVIPVGDPVNSNYFYIFNPNGEMLVSSNKGVSFAVAGTPGASSTPWTTARIRTVPEYEGHLWVPLVDNGLKYSTDHGATYTKVTTVTSCKAVGIGKAISSTSYPAIYIWGVVDGVRGLFRSVDKGATWVKLNDDAHQFGGASIMLGDPNVFGRIYLSSTSGRGIIYWDDLTKYTVSVTKLPAEGGTVTGAGTYAIGSTATLTATPAAGYTFTGWSGDVTGTATSVTVDITGDKSVTANFQAIKYTLTTTATPDAGGTVSGAGSYIAGSTATVTATPAAGYIFTGWSGDATGTAATTTVTMNGNKSVTANFELAKYTLTATASPSAGGTITGAGSYTAGSTATLTATPATGYTFVGWSGDATGTSTTVTVTMDGDKTVTATFQEIKYTLTATASPSAGGTVTGAGSYTAGSTATLTATPAAGYTFVGWSGDATGSTSSITVTMDGNKTVTANFEAIKYTLTATASPSAGGTVSGAGSYTSGSTATLTATPAAGYTFVGWSGDATGSTSSINITMDGDKTVTATFQEIKYTLTATASPSAGGTITGAGSYTSGSTATLTATPAAGYTFVGWSGDATGSTSSVNVTMDGDKTVTATFQEIKYTLTATASPSAGGTITGAGSYTSGSTATLTATPAAGYTFTGWSGDATGSTSSINVTMDGDKTVTANFEAIKYTLATTASPAAGGTVTGAGSYTFGSTATLTATPAAGYTFAGWSGDATGTSSSVTVTMDGNKSVTATFEVIQPDKYTLTTVTSPVAGGTVSGGGSYTSGSTATLTATPAAGYTFTGWSGDATGSTSSINVTMDGNKTVTANFEAIKYTLTATVSPSAGGTITGEGSYTSGSTATLTATPAAGYTFTGWSGDATGSTSSINVTMDGNKTVTANFEAIKYTLTATASPSAGGTITGAGSYTSGSTATLTVTPASGYTFVGWSGDATGSTSSINVTMDGDKTVTANFEAIKYTLTATASPSAGGTVSGAGSYTSGSTATLTATPASGYTFTGWSGDATGTSSSITVTMNGNKSVTATFEVIQPGKYTLTTATSPVAGGTVSGGGSYTSGSTATLTATPVAGYTFTGWSGDASGTSTTVTVTMDGDKSVTANFQAISYTLATTSSPSVGGTVTGGGSYISGSTATLTATPAAGYTFTGWSGDATGTASSITVTMDGDKNITANFQEQSGTTKYTLAIATSPSDGGSVNGAGSYDAGSVVTLTATPAAGYTFTGWSGDVTGTDVSVSVTMDGDKTVTANFQQQSNTTKYTVAITTSPSNGGSVSGAGSYDAGSMATLTATPAEGYTFTGWSGDITGTDATQTITVNSDIVVQANFQGIDAVALKIPKLFSPDSHGDMSTEAWNIENAYLLDGCEIVIYNRQGQQVYSSTGYTTPWDGTSNGKPLPDGAYFYIIRHPDNSKQTGSVTIARLK